MMNSEGYIRWKLDGDLSVGRDVAIGGGLLTQGSGHIKGNLRVDGWLFAHNVRVANKGRFETEEDLKATYPNPENGWWAIVDQPVLGQIYIAFNGRWVKTTGIATEVDPVLTAEVTVHIEDILD